MSAFTRRSAWSSGLLVAGMLAGAGLDRIAAAQSGITRTELSRTDVPGTTNYEAVMGIAELAPGASSGRHFHNGIEIGYILEGTVAVERPDGSVVTLKQGQAFRNPVTEVHNASNRSTTPVKILAVYIVEKGKPLANPAR